MVESLWAVGAPPRTPLGSSQRSPDPLDGGEWAAAAPSPRTQPPPSAYTVLAPMKNLGTPLSLI